MLRVVSMVPCCPILRAWGSRQLVLSTGTAAARGSPGRPNERAPASRPGEGAERRPMARGAAAPPPRA